jgi:hypothetical protein
MQGRSPAAFAAARAHIAFGVANGFTNGMPKNRRSKSNGELWADQDNLLATIASQAAGFAECA